MSDRTALPLFISDSVTKKKRFAGSKKVIRIEAMTFALLKLIHFSIHCAATRVSRRLWQKFLHRRTDRRREPEEILRRLKRRNVYKVDSPIIAWLVDRDHGSLNSPACSCVSTTTKKPHASENRAAFILHYPRARRLTTQPLRDQPHANCLRLRNKHARECRV